MYPINRSEIQTQQTLKIINQDLTSLAANANQNVLNSSVWLLAPKQASEAWKENLQSIVAVTKDIYNTRVKKVNELSSLQNSQTPTYIQTINNSTDDALLKATQIYIETHNSNKQTALIGKQVIIDIVAYKNSFSLVDPIKNNQKNESLMNLCRQEIKTVRGDPNLCK